MSNPARPAVTALYALVVSLFAVLLVLVLWLLPLGIAQAHERWFFYKHRNNPACNLTDAHACFSFALTSCAPPSFYVSCYRRDQRHREGICLCGGAAAEGYIAVTTNVAAELEYEMLHADAGADASP